MRGVWLCVLAVLGAIGIGVGAEAAACSHAARPAHEHVATVSAQVRDRLRSLARSFAEQNGDPGLDRATVLLTTRERAAGGDIVGSDQPVYLVVLRGHFVCRLLCQSTPAARPVRARFVTISIDRATLQGTDWGVTNRPHLPSGTPSFTLIW